MFVRIFFFLVGFGLTLVGSFLIILYLNFMTIGYSFFEYVNFIIRSPEFIITLLGFIILNLSIFINGGSDYEFYL